MAGAEIRAAGLAVTEKEGTMLDAIANLLRTKQGNQAAAVKEYRALAASLARGETLPAKDVTDLEKVMQRLELRDTDLAKDVAAVKEHTRLADALGKLDDKAIRAAERAAFKNASMEAAEERQKEIQRLQREASLKLLAATDTLIKLEKLKTALADHQSNHRRMFAPVEIALTPPEPPTDTMTMQRAREAKVKLAHV